MTKPNALVGTRVFMIKQPNRYPAVGAASIFANIFCIPWFFASFERPSAQMLGNILGNVACSRSGTIGEKLLGLGESWQGKPNRDANLVIQFQPKRWLPSNFLDRRLIHAPAAFYTDIEIRFLALQSKKHIVHRRNIDHAMDAEQKPVQLWLHNGRG